MPARTGRPARGQVSCTAPTTGWSEPTCTATGPRPRGRPAPVRSSGTSTAAPAGTVTTASPAVHQDAAVGPTHLPPDGGRLAARGWRAAAWSCRAPASTPGTVEEVPGLLRRHLLDALRPARRRGGSRPAARRRRRRGRRRRPPRSRWRAAGSPAAPRGWRRRRRRGPGRGRSHRALGRQHGEVDGGGGARGVGQHDPAAAAGLDRAADQPAGLGRRRAGARRQTGEVAVVGAGELQAGEELRAVGLDHERLLGPGRDRGQGRRLDREVLGGRRPRAAACGR